jgi:serine/threonine-protein kinase
VRALRPDLPAGIEDVVSRCLAKERERRFQNVAELAAALEPYSSAHAKPSIQRILRTVERRAQPPSSASPVAAPHARHASHEELSPTISASTGPSASTRTQATWGTTGSSPRKSARLKLGGGALVASVALVAGIVHFAGRSPDRAAAGPSRSAPESASEISPQLPSAPPPDRAPAAPSAEPVATAAAAPTGPSSATPPSATMGAPAVSTKGPTPRSAGAPAAPRTTAVTPAIKPATPAPKPNHDIF